MWIILEILNRSKFIWNLTQYELGARYAVCYAAGTNRFFSSLFLIIACHISAPLVCEVFWLLICLISVSSWQFLWVLLQWPECFCHWLILNPILLLKLCCYVLVWITSCLSTAMFMLCFTASKSPCERQISKGSLSLGSSASLPPQTGNRDNLPMLNTKILYPSECNTTVPSSSPLECGWQQSRLKPLYKAWNFSAWCPFAGSTWK